jgi:hypothetical protein
VRQRLGADQQRQTDAGGNRKLVDYTGRNLERILLVRGGVCMRFILAFSMLLLCFPAHAQEMSFRSPTGNIHCMIFTGSYSGARCDLGQFTQTYPRPPDCDLDWGFAFEVGAVGPGIPICAGDTVRNPGTAILDYGHSIRRGGITCLSERTGMTCTNAAGHGFKIARARQKVF